MAIAAVGTEVLEEGADDTVAVVPFIGAPQEVQYRASAARAAPQPVQNAWTLMGTLASNLKSCRAG